MKMGIGIGWPNASAGISYAKKLIKAFKERVLSYPNSIFEAEPCLDATLAGLNAIGLLKQASLVITPNAYNEGVLYDVVPNTTLGDMDVVRATTATRVNSAGLIEVVPRNLLPYSNTFTNGVWIQQAGTSIIPNNAISPDGLMNATKVISNGSNGIYQAPVIVSTTVNNTKSIYLKGVIGGETVLLRDPWQTVSTTTCVLTTEWQRFTLSETQSGGEAGLWVKNVPSTGIYIYGAQLEQGSTATEYFPTTTRLNIPRIDYTNGSCPSLLVEPQRSNGYIYSEQFDLWDTKNNAIITPNYSLSPDGTQNADRYLSTGTGWIFVGNGKANGISTLSIWAKRNNSGTERFGFFINGDGSIAYEFNLTNQWQRFTYQVDVTNLYQGLAADIGADVSIWGMQLELGSYATSYIPTVATSVTRNADVISKTGISSLIGQTEGTIFWEGYLDGSANSGQLVGVGKSGFDVIRIQKEGLLVLSVQVYNNGFAFIKTFPFVSGYNKIAFVYKSGNSFCYLNGIKVVTDTSTFAFTGVADEIDINNLWQSNSDITMQSINSIQLYKTVLTDTECLQLTTL